MGCPATVAAGQRWCEFVRLSRHEQEMEQPSGRIANADQLGAKAAARSAQHFAALGNLANESQTQHRCLPGRAPDRSTAEPQIRMVAIAKFGRDRTPFHAIVDPPNNRFDRPAVLSPRPCATNVGAPRPPSQICPLRVRQNLHRLSTPTIKPISCTVAAASPEMRTDPSLDWRPSR